MMDTRVLQAGAAGVILVFLGLLIFDAVSVEYVVPLPLYGTISLIFGGGAAFGLKARSQEKTQKKEKPGETDES